MGTLRLLHLEDSPTDAFLVRNALAEAAIGVDILHAASREEFTSRVKHGGLDAILVDSGLPDISSKDAIAIARAHHPATPIIVVSNAASPKQVSEMLSAGAADYILKGHWWQLICALRRAVAGPGTESKRGLTRLITAVQELSMARGLDQIMAIVRKAAREISGADGSTFVLRDDDKCYYADEDAIGPLWKGQRFPMTACISGWAMLNRQPVVCEDIEADARIPLEAYRRTFVKSLVVVPIRSEAPIGAIGNYWATLHTPTPEDVELLQALANTTAVAMENANVYADLERRVRSRTLVLEATNKELESFSYSVAHDLRSHLHAISGYTDLIAMKLERNLDADARDYIDEIHGGVERMTSLINDLLKLGQINKHGLRPTEVDLSAIATGLLARMKSREPDRKVETTVQPGLTAWADRGMMEIVFENLLSNAWKYSSKREVAVISVGSDAPSDGQAVFYVRDNGAGFDMRRADDLFTPFKRLHRNDEFEGTGIGLATVQRVIHLHKGLIWANAEVDRGATFYFTLPLQESARAPVPATSTNN